jgi:hypothetical protein
MIGDGDAPDAGHEREGRTAADGHRFTQMRFPNLDFICVNQCASVAHNVCANSILILVRKNRPSSWGNVQSDHNILCLPDAAMRKTHKIVFLFGSRATRRL